MIAGTAVAADDEVLLLRAYLAFNARDASRLLALVAPDVDWADGRGGRLHGRDAVAAHWARAWSRALVHDHPVALARRSDGSVAARVEQVVRLLDGSPPTATSFTHVHHLAGGRIRLLDLERDPLGVRR